MEKSIKQSLPIGKQTVKSSMLRAGKRTFFFDVRIASNNEQSSRPSGTKKYLKITESVFMGEGRPRRYNSLIIFPENVVDFQQRLTEISNYLS